MKRKYNPIIVSANLKLLRQLSGKTQSQIAEETGIALSSIKQYESGKRIPDVYNLNKLCDLFNVTSKRILE